LRILLSGVGCCPGPLINTENVAGELSSPFAAGLAVPPLAVLLFALFVLFVLFELQPVIASASANVPAANARVERFTVLCILLCLPFLDNCFLFALNHLVTSLIISFKNALTIHKL